MAPAILRGWGAVEWSDRGLALPFAARLNRKTGAASPSFRCCGKEPWPGVGWVALSIAAGGLRVGDHHAVPVEASIALLRFLRESLGILLSEIESRSGFTNR